MNWKELPPDDWRFETESAEERERLSQIEQRLRAARPQTVQLDAAAWARIVSASQTSVVPDEGIASLPARVSPLRRRWHPRAVGAIAAAWLVGAAVGAGVMVLVMDRGEGMAQADRVEKPVAVVRPNAPDPPADIEVRPQPPLQPSSITRDTTEAEPRSSDPPVIAPVRIVQSASWLDRPLSQHAGTLRAFGRELVEGAAVEMQRSRSLRLSGLPEEQVQLSETQRALARSFVPPRGATPRDLWDDLRTSGEIF